jgi:hypothetical protein
VVLARSRGWLMGGSTIASGVANPPEPEEGVTPQQAEALAAQAEPPLPPPPELRLSALALNLALTGLAVAFGVVALAGLRRVADHVGGGLAMVVDVFPVFPLALVGSLLVRWLLERSGKDHWVSTRVQNRLGTVSADLLITAATACLDLTLLAHDWMSLTALALAGLAWNLGVLLLLAPRILPSAWFERGIIEFGQATGVAASGLLLLRMADPLDRSEALQPFSIKQLLLQPIVAGGVITVVALGAAGLDRALPGAGAPLGRAGPGPDGRVPKPGLRPSAHHRRHVAPIDGQHRAGGALHQGQGHEGLRHIAGPHLLTQQVAGHVGLLADAPGGGAFLDHALIQQAGADAIGIDGIGAHPFATALEGVLAHQSHQGRLGDAIGAEAGAGVERLLAHVEEQLTAHSLGAEDGHRCLGHALV